MAPSIRVVLCGASLISTSGDPIAVIRSDSNPRSKRSIASRRLSTERPCAEGIGDSVPLVDGEAG